MAHNCPTCGALCYCDGEDPFTDDVYVDCTHWEECEAEENAECEEA